jgi:hypothetical protein
LSKLLHKRDIAKDVDSRLRENDEF